MSDQSVFDGNRWYQKEIDRRTRQAIEEQNELFRQEHANDTDRELLALLSARKAELGYVPQPVEVLGADLLIKRFGSWDRAIQMAGYRFAKGTSKLTLSQRYKDEHKKQVILYKADRQKRSEMKAERKAMHEEYYRSKKQTQEQK